MLPKPMDFVILLEQAINAGAHMATLSSMPDIQKTQALGEFNPLMAWLTSILSSGAMLGIAGRHLSQTDY